MNKNDNILVYQFDDLAAAEAAVAALHEWDERVNDVKLGVIGLAYPEDGAVKSKVVHTAGLFKRSFPMSDAGLRALGAEMTEGRVAVVVAADDYEVSMVQDSLVRSGGRLLVSNYERTPEEIAEEQAKVAAAQAANAIEAVVLDTRAGLSAQGGRPV